MILGVDPKNDYAFKRVFGSEKHTDLLVDLLNAVMNPPPGRKVVSVDILNPITEQEKIDEKLSILDVRARDQQGRHFIVEMQMTIHPGLAERLLFYGAKKYGSQLQTGDDYVELQPVICICFLDGRLFRQTDRWHLHFQLWETSSQVLFSDQLQIHLFQLPNFTKTADQITNEIEMWLYFLNNGEKMDSEKLPPTLEKPPVREAMEVLHMLTRDERERERYFDREKAKRDARSFEAYWKRQEEQWKQQEEQWKQQEEQWKQQEEQWKQQEEQWMKREEELQQEATAGLIVQIHLCQQFLKQTPTPEEELKTLSLQELHQRAEGLRQQVSKNGKAE